MQIHVMAARKIAQLCTSIVFKQVTMYLQTAALKIRSSGIPFNADVIEFDHSFP